MAEGPHPSPEAMTSLVFHRIREESLNDVLTEAENFAHIATRSIRLIVYVEDVFAQS